MKLLKYFLRLARTDSGFTLIELMVVVVIMATLMVLILPKLSLFSKSQALENEALRLQTALRVAQNNAASGIKCNSTVPASEWYLKFTDTATYYLETVCSGSEVGALTPTPTPPISTKYLLPSGISIVNINVDYTSGLSCIVPAGELAKIRMSFSNIASKVDFPKLGSVSGCTNTEVAKMTVILQIDSDPSKTMKVTIEKGGPIYISSN